MKNLMTGFVILFSFTCTHAQEEKGAQYAVNTFVTSLSSEEKKKCLFELTDEERYNWNFVPKSRKGIALKELDTRQSQLFVKILQAALSNQGYEKASSIMQLENVLKALESRSSADDYRDQGKYYFSLFGQPSAERTWGWRIEGHHLALNCLYNKNELACTPSFMGSNPAVVPSGDAKGKQILKQESEKAFALLRSLSKEQQAEAIIAERAFPEIITGNDRKVNAESAKGIAFTKMNSIQQKLFRELIAVYIMNFSPEAADMLMKEIESSGFDKMHFAWAGALQWGQGHYYRIQGPATWIEYDNVQNNANHVHTSIRSLKSDFGEDLLKKHYEEDHHKAPKE